VIFVSGGPDMRRAELALCALARHHLRRSLAVVWARNCVHESYIAWGSSGLCTVYLAPQGRTDFGQELPGLAVRKLRGELENFVQGRGFS
jgi:hypothetical protein